MSKEEFLYFYNCEDILNDAKFGKSLIIVEGEYDYIYEYVDDNHCEITTVQKLINQSGNKAIEKLVLEIEAFAKSENLEYKSNILGIIDRDYREYENNLIQSDILYILDFYSIESYFVNREVLKNMLLFVIRSERLVTDELIDKIYQNINIELEKEFYLKSIQKLKTHLNFQQDIISLEKKFNISKSFDILLKITKGKELLNRFILKNIEYQQKLYNWCKDKEITPCKNIDNDEHNKFCLYKITKYQTHQLKNIIFKNININSLTPIKQRISQLK
jgi:hypothetical protein